MNKILIFAGTTEGRELAEFLGRHKIVCHICVATEYGEQLIDQSHYGHFVHAGRLASAEMAELIQKEQITIAVDATHPYAEVVSEQIRDACVQTGCRYIRLLREQSEADWDGCLFVNTIEEAVSCLKKTTGVILAATGSKDLAKYTALPNYRERVVARVLSTEESMKICSELGFRGKNLICMQGPFTEDLNYAMLRQTGAEYLVTKESGKTGGFSEKVSAARRAGAQLIVVGRPAREEGMTGYQVRALLCRELNIKACPSVELVGIGMGAPEQLTLEAERICREADVLIGAGRMLEQFRTMKKPFFVSYQPQEIRQYLEEHPEYERAAVLLSGDVGFYSGAKGLLEVFPQGQVNCRCGISSVVYLCAKLGRPWQDVRLISMHGRKQNLIAAVRSSRRVFALAGTAETFHDMCRELTVYGLGHVILHVGCRLSYPQECIITGTPEEFAEQKLDDLISVLIENPKPDKRVTHGLEDEEFVRTTVPMTKSEIRSISLSKLRLQTDSILYDVGAGTGSVSIEAALQAADGFVYAIEKKPEAAELIRQNQRQLRAANMEVVEGLAPEALQALPVPSHAFIGGSSGNLKQIMQVLLRKNPKIRIVINAIALETVSEALQCLKDLPVSETDIVTVSVGKSRSVGSYHMMFGQNPVYIISCTGTGDRVCI